MVKRHHFYWKDWHKTWFILYIYLDNHFIIEISILYGVGKRYIKRHYCLPLVDTPLTDVDKLSKGYSKMGYSPVSSQSAMWLLSKLRQLKTINRVVKDLDSNKSQFDCQNRSKLKSGIIIGSSIRIKVRFWLKSDFN